ncbi:MAG: SocA family protein [Verrucomicrobia bacterium]|nr:SocA family protein [Verrucomicrobiota bacterium]
MNKIKEAVAYFTKNYLSKSDLSNARITKLIYLSDWHHAINYQSQITTINWYFDNYGPFVNDVFDAVCQHKDIFNIKIITNIYGSDKTIFILKDENYIPVLDESERQSLDHIINITQNLNWNDFIKLVYSTYPIASSQRYTHLDLLKKAREYKGLK